MLEDMLGSRPFSLSSDAKFPWRRQRHRAGLCAEGEKWVLFLPNGAEPSRREALCRAEEPLYCPWCSHDCRVP